MSLFKWADSVVKSMTVWDVGFLKIYVAVFGMIIGAYYSNFVLSNINWFYGAFFILMAIVLYRVFKNK